MRAHKIRWKHIQCIYIIEKHLGLLYWVSFVHFHLFFAFYFVFIQFHSMGVCACVRLRISLNHHFVDSSNPPPSPSLPPVLISVHPSSSLCTLCKIWTLLFPFEFKITFAVLHSSYQIVASPVWSNNIELQEKYVHNMNLNGCVCVFDNKIILSTYPKQYR